MTESSQGAAGLQEIKDASNRLGTLITAQLPRIHQLEATVQQLNTAVQGLCARPPPVPDPGRGAASNAPAASAPLPVSHTFTVPLIAPQPFSGEPNACRGFALQCSNAFLHQAHLFPSEPAKVGYIISRLSGPALDWATAVSDRQLPVMNNSELFLRRLSVMFDTGHTVDQAAQRVLTITQGNRSVAQYAVEFRTAAVRSGWEDQSLRAAFYHGLQESVKDEMVNRDWGQTLDELVHLAICLDARIQERRRDRRETRTPWTVSLPRRATPTLTLSPGEPRELGRLRLSREERSRRLQRGLCLYCGSSGHQRQHCPDLQRRGHSSRDPEPLMSGSAKTPGAANRLSLPIRLRHIGEDPHIVSLAALVDSGAAVNLMDLTLAKQLGIPTTPVATPQAVQALDGRPLGSGYLERVTVPLIMSSQGGHQETISFWLTTTPQDPVVLGYPWLAVHEPQFGWAEGSLLHWGSTCVTAGHLPPTAPPVSCVSPLEERFKTIPPTTSASVSSAGTPPNVNILAPLVGTDISQVPAVYHDLAEVFSKLKATTLPPHRQYDCAIDLLPGTSPPRGRLYPLSVSETQAMKDYIEDALRLGLIRPSSSPAAAPFFFVGKKDGGLRPCIDYRGLNNITRKNKYPLPLMSTAFERLQGATVFTKLDLRNAYHLVRIRPGDEWKTAFITPSGHYEYLVMPFGLSNSPAVFQALINDVLREFLEICVFVYLDDILIFSQSPQEHIGHVRAVLKALLQNKLFCKVEKCEFHSPSTTFLGFVVGPQGLSMDLSKVKAIVDWPTPTNIKQVQSFLGFANFYRRFIRNYSALASPIISLLHGGPRRLVWTDTAQKAFEHLKQRFCSAPILTLPDPTLPFVVEVDASDSGVGAILSQRAAGDDKLHPCAFFSRALSPAEHNYDVGNRELLAIKLALEEWRHWLEGASDPFLIYTDHKNLGYINESKRLNPRQARWALFFSRFNFVVTFRPGSKNGKADALSRLHTSEAKPAAPDPIIPPSKVVAAVRCNLEEEIRQTQGPTPAPKETPQGLLFVPTSCRTKALEWAHSSRLAGHPGVRRTLELLQRRFWWPRLRQEVTEYVAACTVCVAAKPDNRKPAGLLQPLPAPHRPWTHISLDFITGLPPSQGNTAILVVVDRFSKAARFIALTKLPTAKQTADVLVREIVRYHGPPEDLVSDRGPQFVARFWKAFWGNLGASVSLTSGYHPQSNGQTERVNQALEIYLRCYTSKDPSKWSQSLLWAEIAHNQQWSAATGTSPFEVMWGYPPHLFPTSLERGDVPAARSSVARLRTRWRQARRVLLQSQELMRRQADRRRRPGPMLRVGQRVWLSTRGLALKGETRKLAPRYVGPFRILRRISRTAFHLELPQAMRIHPVFHRSVLRPATSSPLCPVPPAPPPAKFIAGGLTYTVRRLLDVRKVGRSTQYLVDWKGYGPEERSWVPAKNIVDKDLIRQFRDSHPGPSGAGPRRGAPVTSMQARHSTRGRPLP